MAEPAQDDDQTPLLEWVFGAIGLLLFAGALVITILNGLSPNEPPIITVRVEAPQPAEGSFRVEFEAVNAGDETAAAVQLVATLKQGDTIIEAHDVVIEFLPPHSSRRAGVFFTHDPKELVLDVQAVSYQHP